jgi:hypothetical protein
LTRDEMESWIKFFANWNENLAIAVASANTARSSKRA